MGHWNYRVIHHEHERGNYYGLHEVYYDKHGHPFAWTVEPTLIGSSPDEIMAALAQMQFDCHRYSATASTKKIWMRGQMHGIGNCGRSCAVGGKIMYCCHTIYGERENDA